MRIPRLHLFELADPPWFPSAIRELVTDYLHFIETRFALHQPTVVLVAEALQRSDSMRIVDLCSGGGGSMPCLLPALVAQGVRLQVTLTDRFPTTQAFQKVASVSIAAGLLVGRNRVAVAGEFPGGVQNLAAAVGARTYRWRAGRVSIVSNPGCLTYLIGYPDETERNCAFGFGSTPALIAPKVRR